MTSKVTYCSKILRYDYYSHEGMVLSNIVKVSIQKRYYHTIPFTSDSTMIGLDHYIKEWLIFEFKKREGENKALCCIIQNFAAIDILCILFLLSRQPLMVCIFFCVA